LNVTPSLGKTLSINASNGARASIPRSAPLAERDALRMAATVGASAGSNGCIETKSVDTPVVVERCMITNPGGNRRRYWPLTMKVFELIDVGESNCPTFLHEKPEMTSGTSASREAPDT
jgi:hypothetical protein